MSPLQDPRGENVLGFAAGVERLRGPQAHEAWANLLAWRPMIPGSFERAPRSDPRHLRAAPASGLLGGPAY